MFSNCLERYSQAGKECEAMTSYLCTEANTPSDKNTPYLARARTVGAYSISAGACCFLINPVIATECCLLPGAVSLLGSELPTCAICILNVFRRTIADTHRSTPSEVKSNIAVDLNDPRKLVITDPKKTYFQSIEECKTDK